MRFSHLVCLEYSVNYAKRLFNGCGVNPVTLLSERTHKAVTSPYYVQAWIQTRYYNMLRCLIDIIRYAENILKFQNCFNKQHLYRIVKYIAIVKYMNTYRFCIKNI